jgi:hypothetical protein
MKSVMRCTTATEMQHALAGVDGGGGGGGGGAGGGGGGSVKY